MFIILIILAILYFKYGYYYAESMVSYIKYNHMPPSTENNFRESEDPAKSLRYELLEFHEAVTNCNFYDMLLEFGDVLHSIIQYIVIGYLPVKIYSSFLCWSVIFFVAFPAIMTMMTMIKMANRYKKFNCMRNHSNPTNCDHICDYNNYGLKN